MRIGCLACFRSNGIFGRYGRSRSVDSRAAIEHVQNWPDARAADALAQNWGPLATPAVGPLVAALSDKSIPVQLEVLIALEHIGPAARAAVPDLVKILKSDQVRLLGGAMNALGSIGRDSLEAVPALTELLKDDDAAVAASAGLALARILPPESDELAPAVRVLVGALKDKRTHVRSTAINALGLAGGLAVPALTQLVKGYATDPVLAWQAAAALEMIGPPAQPAVAVLVEALSSPSEKLVCHSAVALGAIGPGAESALAPLRKVLARNHASICTHAVSALGNLGPAAAPAVGDLTALLKDRDAGVRREAAQALGKIGPAAKAAVPAIVAALSDMDGTVTMQAAMALGRIGPAAVPALIGLLKDPNLRHLAVMILADIGPEAKPAVEALASMQLDPNVDRDFRREILLTLARIGPDARGAVPVLMTILGDKEHTLRPGAAWALAKIGAKQAAPLLVEALAKNENTHFHDVAPIALAVLEPDNEGYVGLAVPKLIEILSHKSYPLRFEAASALIVLGPRAAAAVPTLAKLLPEGDPALRSAYLSALAAIGPASAAALPVILNALSDPEIPVRYAASYAIGRIGPEAKDALPLLEKNLQERDEMLQIASAWAIVQVAPGRDGQAGQCLAPLTRALALRDPQTRSAAATALGQMGAAAGPAAPSLKELAADPNDTVRKSAAEAVKKIGSLLK